jgi:hypothetical protein
LDAPLARFAILEGHEMKTSMRRLAWGLLLAGLARMRDDNDNDGGWRVTSS